MLGFGAWFQTPKAFRVLSLAVQEARGLKHTYLGQEHLLLALLRGDTVVADVLAGFDVTYGLAKSQIVALLEQARPTRDKTKARRYNLVLPEDLFLEVERVADREGVTVLEVLRRSVKLGLLAAHVRETQGASLLIREGGVERELLVL